MAIVETKITVLGYIPAEESISDSDIDLIGNVPISNGLCIPDSEDAVVYESSLKANIFEDLDIVGAIGSPRRALVWLKVDFILNTNWWAEVSFRANGDTHEVGQTSVTRAEVTTDKSVLIVCDTDENGVFEWSVDYEGPGGELSSLTLVEVTVLGYIPEEEAGPTVLTVIPGYLTLQIIFSEDMIDDEELRDITNYTITPLGNDRVTCEILDIEVQDAAYPSYVILSCTDVTHDYGYRLTVTPDRVRSRHGVYLVGGNTADYDAVSIYPGILSVIPTSNTIMEVTFTKSMTINDDYVNAAKYTFDKGLQVLSVEMVSPFVIKLHTTKQTPSEYYTLTIVP